MDSFRFLWNRLRGRATLLDRSPMGVPMRLSVRAGRELRRVRSVPAEAPFLARILESLSGGDVVYDVGANIGLVALVVALDPRGHSCVVHCFEPEPRNFAQLKGNIRLNGVAHRVHPHRLALSDREGETDLYVRGGPGEGRHSTVAREGSTASIRIRTEPLATFAARAGRGPDVVKIDVEGAEGRVLVGMRPLFPARPPRELFLELHDKGEHDAVPGGGTVRAWLERRGYTLAWESERGRSRHQHYRRLAEGCSGDDGRG